MNIITKIENFNRNKSYPIQQPLTKYIPIYGTKCSCHYGYKCDDKDFNPKEPINYMEVSITDPRKSITDH